MIRDTDLGVIVVTLPAGRHFFRGDEGYEAARRATVWNARTPERYPAVIVQAASAADVVAAIRYANTGDLKIGVRPGGHSWAGNHVRDGGLLLDVSGLDECSVDAERMVAVVGPGKGGSELTAELESQRLFFPTGHCKGVCIGGYLLQGGYGWNSRVLGPACESVIGVDVVTADGDQIYCDADHYPDLYWAARGSGPGFFGVATAFHLKLYPRPAICGSSLYVYPIELADDPADDEKYSDWARSNMAAMSHLASGIQLADENLGQRPAKFATDESMARLDKLRAQYDPHERFFTWMGRT